METEAAVFKALGDPTRLKLAVILAVAGETCVCHLATALEVQDFNVSRHLSVLRAAGMVEARRQGTWMYYRLTQPRSPLEQALHSALRDALGNHPLIIEAFRRRLENCCG